MSYVNLRFTNPNNKAIGPVIRRCADAGLIAKTGRTRPARTSHGSPKPEWMSTIRRYTYVCTACCAGWEQDERKPTVHRCGTDAILRGEYQVIDVFPQDQSEKEG